MKMIPFGKSLETSISLHFASYINSYIHIFICSVSISIWYFKNEQIYWKSSQVVQQSYKFSCHKKNNAIAFGKSWPTRTSSNSSDLETWRKGELSIQHWTRTSCKGQRNRGWATKLFPNDGLSIYNQPFLNSDASGATIRSREKFRKTLCGSIQGTRFRRSLWTREVESRIVQSIEWHWVIIDIQFTWAKTKDNRR